EHAPEGLARPQRDEGEIDAFRLDPAVDQRLGAVVAPARDGELDPGHSLSPPPASLRAQRSNLTSLAHEYWAEIASSPFGLLAMTPFPTTRCSDCGCSGRSRSGSPAWPGSSTHRPRAPRDDRPSRSARASRRPRTR